MSQIVLTALPDIPLVKNGDDLSSLILNGLKNARITLQGRDVIVLASKIVSKAQGRSVQLDAVTPSARAVELATATNKDAREIELMLQESAAIVRARKGLIITRHRL